MEAWYLSTFYEMRQGSLTRGSALFITYFKSIIFLINSIPIKRRKFSEQSVLLFIKLSTFSVIYFSYNILNILLTQAFTNLWFPHLCCFMLNIYFLQVLPGIPLQAFSSSGFAQLHHNSPLLTYFIVFCLLLTDKYFLGTFYINHFYSK